MLPSACPNENHRQRAAARSRHGLIVAAIALVCSAAWAVEHEGPDADSGWAVGTPATAILDAKSSDPQMPNILHHVLQQTRVPLLRESGPKLLHPEDAGPRVAERPNAGEGWRGSGLHVSPLLTTTPTHSESRPTFPAELPLTLNGPTASPHLAATEASADDDEPQISTLADTANSLPVVTPSADSEQEDTNSDADISEDPVGDASNTDAEAAERSTNTEPESQTTEQLSDGSSSSTVTDSAVPMPLVEKSPPQPLTRQLVNLRGRVRSVLRGYYRKPLNSREHDCWEAMHGMLAYGIHSRILQGSSRGEPITAVGWLCYNKPCKGLTLMYVTPQGELRAKWGVGLQGHTGQLLAMLAQCKVSPDYPIHVGKNEFTIHDLIEAEKKTCYPKTELTFKLLAFQQYLDLNEKWVNDQGLDWDIPRLIREEIAQPIRGAACGGTHRLSSLSLTVKARVRRGEPLDGEYARAAEFVEKYEKYAFRLQNRDGSLSTEWFRGRGDDDDKDRRIKTTGHILEWLCYSLSDEELREPQTIRAVTYLANLMYSNYDHEWEIGPRSHATHALLLYDERVFKPFDREGEMASYRPISSTANRSQRRTTSQR